MEAYTCPLTDFGVAKIVRGEQDWALSFENTRQKIILNFIVQLTC